MPSTSLRWTSGRMWSSDPIAAPEPEYSWSGAMMTTSPNRRIVRARTWSPTESMPSSLVTMMRTVRPYRRRFDLSQATVSARRTMPRPWATTASTTMACQTSW